MTTGVVSRIPVVFVIDNMRIGGTELNAVRTAELLDRKRFDLRIVCFKPDGPIRERYRALGIPVVSYPLNSLYGPSMIVSGYRFARYLHQHRVQIVHSHCMYSNIFAAPWARVARVPVVIASRRWWHSLPNRKLQIGNKAAFHTATAVLANSPQVARSVLESERVPGSRIWTVSNFVDESAFVPLSAEQRTDTRVEWKVPADTLVIGCVARMLPVKDHESLIRAFEILRVTHRNIHLVLVGDGESRRELEELAVTRGVSDSVTFTGEISNGQNHHRVFDISVLCSLSEGFPNSLVEAMAAGAPIVATSVGGNVDAVVDGENGLLVPVSQPEALANALSVLVGDSELRQRMGAAGRNRARNKYRATEAVGSLQSMYDTLLSGSARQ